MTAAAMATPVREPRCALGGFRLRLVAGLRPRRRGGAGASCWSRCRGCSTATSRSRSRQNLEHARTRSMALLIRSEIDQVTNVGQDIQRPLVWTSAHPGAGLTPHRCRYGRSSEGSCADLAPQTWRCADVDVRVPPPGDATTGSPVYTSWLRTLDATPASPARPARTLLATRSRPSADALRTGGPSRRRARRAAHHGHSSPAPFTSASRPSTTIASVLLVAAVIAWWSRPSSRCAARPSG